MASSSVGWRVLVAGVGHPCWSDRSLGPVLVQRLARRSLPEHVDLEEFSFGAIAVMQRLEERKRLYRRCVFVAAEERGRQPGRVYVYRWAPGCLDPDRVQRLVTEAGAGVVALDPLLHICTYFGVLPDDVAVLEVEPVSTAWGEELSPDLLALLPSLEDRVLNLVDADSPPADPWPPGGGGDPAP